jgi:hypothetical protein
MMGGLGNKEPVAPQKSAIQEMKEAIELMNMIKSAAGTPQNNGGGSDPNMTLILQQFMANQQQQRQQQTAPQPGIIEGFAKMIEQYQKQSEATMQKLEAQLSQRQDPMDSMMNMYNKIKEFSKVMNPGNITDADRAFQIRQMEMQRQQQELNLQRDLKNIELRKEEERSNQTINMVQGFIKSIMESVGKPLSETFASVVKQRTAEINIPATIPANSIQPNPSQGPSPLDLFSKVGSALQQQAQTPTPTPQPDVVPTQLPITVSPNAPLLSQPNSTITPKSDINIAPIQMKIMPKYLNPMFKTT